MDTFSQSKSKSVISNGPCLRPVRPPAPPPQAGRSGLGTTALTQYPDSWPGWWLGPNGPASSTGPAAPAVGDLRQPSDVLIIPSGPEWERLIKDDAFLDMVRQLNEKARLTSSVCTGAFEQVRMEAARAMLETGDDTLDVVARRAGFGSPESLRRAFTRHLGVVRRLGLRTLNGGGLALSTVAGVHGATGEDAGIATGLNNASMQIGSAIGLAALVSLGASHAALLQHAGLDRITAAPRATPSASPSPPG